MDIIMPKMGESVNEGTIIKWHKNVGDKVKRDEIIFEISTDKVDTEIPSPDSGVIAEMRIPEGDTVEVGTVVAILNTNGETVTDTKHEEPVQKKNEFKEIKKEWKNWKIYIDYTEDIKILLNIFLDETLSKNIWQYQKYKILKIYREYKYSGRGIMVVSHSHTPSNFMFDL